MNGDSFASPSGLPPGNRQLPKQKNADPYYDVFNEKDRTHSEDFGEIPHCCDVGFTRNEEGEKIPCDYSG